MNLVCKNVHFAKSLTSMCFGLEMCGGGIQEILPQFGALGTLFLKFPQKAGTLLTLNLNMSWQDDYSTELSHKAKHEPHAVNQILLWPLV